MNCVVYADCSPSDDLVAAFGDAGFEPITAETIAECRSIVEREPTRIACLVSAHSLGDGTCLELCRQFASEPVPVVVCPADGSETLAGEVLAAGGDGYVPRASAPETLLERVRTLAATQQSALFRSLDDEQYIGDLETEGRTTSGAANSSSSPLSSLPSTVESHSTMSPSASPGPGLESGATDDAVAPSSATLENLLSEADPNGSLEELLEYTDADVSLALTQEHATDRERAGTIVEVVGESVYSLDSAGRFVTVNETLAEVSGYDRAELIGNHISMILSAESIERRQKRLRALSSAGGQPDDAVATYEVTLETQAGRQIPCEINATLFDAAESEDSSGGGTVGIIRDISDRKRMKRELHAHEAKIASLHDVASKLDDCETREEIYEVTVTAAEEVLQFDVCVVDMVEGSLLVKKAVSTGLDVEVEQTMSVEEGIAGKTYRTGRTHRVDDITTNPTAKTESDEFRSVLSIPIGDHGVFQAVSSDFAAFDHDDQELAELLLSHVSDALERFDFEAEIRAERDRFAALFENVPDAAVSTRQRSADAPPIIEAVNPAFEQIFGYDESELLGEPLDQFIVPPDRNAEALSINHRSGQGSVVETEVKRRTTDGIRDFMIRVVPIESDDEVERSVGLYTDITDRKRRRKRLEILNRVLRHDLRNGMNIINGCAEVVADKETGETEDYATIIQERANELIGLAEKTRAVERTLEQDGSMTTVVDAVDITEQALERFEHETDFAGDRPYNLSVSLPEQQFVRASHYLETALIQVLENALEHNDSSPPVIGVRLSEGDTDDDLVTLSISDNGPGIPTEERELLQDEREITQLRHASGLGLWLVNWVVAQSGGRLTFAANEPYGTTVELQLPRAETETIQYVADEDDK